MRRIRNLQFVPMENETHKPKPMDEAVFASTAGPKTTTWADVIKADRLSGGWLRIMNEEPQGALTQAAYTYRYRPLLKDTELKQDEWVLLGVEQNPHGRVRVGPCYQCMLNEGWLKTADCPRLYELHFERKVADGDTEKMEHRVQWVCEHCSFANSPSQVPKDPRSIRLQFVEIFANMAKVTSKKKDLNKKARDQYG